MRKQIKCVVVGDTGVGRTSLLITYVTKKYPTGYIPTVFDMYYLDVNLEDGEQAVTLALSEALCDNGTEEHDRLRPLGYPKTDVVLVCFSLLDRTSYEHVRVKWHLEFKKHCPNAVIILVGTKLDTRNDKEYIEQLNKNGSQLITTGEGVQLAKEIGAEKYLECSSRMQQGVKEVFDEVIMVGLLVKKTAWNNTNCVLL